MADTSRSKRFKPNLVTEKVVPVVLVVLLVVLLAVLIVIGLSLAGSFPAG
jgi:hypothetical protein